MRRLLVLSCAALLACSAAEIDSPGQPDGGIPVVDAPVSTVDAPVSTVDAPVSTVDAQLSTVDAPVSTVDAPVPIADAPPAAHDAPPPTPDGPPITGTLSPFIAVDQFGYRPGATKVAVIRDPQTGFDDAQSFTPGSTLAVVDARNGATVLQAAPAPWNGGATDGSSGDRAWWLDFSAVTTPGEYYVLDAARGARSDVFRIADDVYRDVMAQATRALFYQRAGFAKSAAHAGAGWADGASHLGALQDPQARLYSAPGDAATEKDLRGGWYDAGDYNKYTSWTAGYVVQLLRAYEENPAAFRDDTGIPESGNGVPDVLDETRWGLDWLVRMQDDDGSVLSIVGMGHASPPSAATGQSRYGSPSTSATLSAAAAYAHAARVYRAADAARFGAYADDLAGRAARAWTWADENPAVIFRNNDDASGTGGLGAGQQETDDYGRLVKKLAAAVSLFQLTGSAGYRAFVDANHGQVHLMLWTYAFPFELEAQEVLLEYTRAAGATPSVVAAIQATYKTAMTGAENLGAHRAGTDPYRAYIKDYTWGSNNTKALQGLIFTDSIRYAIDPATDAEALRAAEGFIHYLHGVNPFGLVYLSNMGAHGAARSVRTMFHSWFAHGSALWDEVGTSTHGPAPGFVVGGPNPSYSWDGCCPSGCSGFSCGSAPLSPPANQPAQKSYREFNDSWPLNSWTITEPSNGYQTSYIRLLAHFAR
jgi:hypothetical protein